MPKKSKPKKKEETKAEARPEAPEAVKKAAKEMLELSEYAKLISARCVAVVNGLASQMGGLPGKAMEPWQAEIYGDNLKETTGGKKLPTPMGTATAPPKGRVPEPEGDKWTAKELAGADFSRPVLAKLLDSLGGDSKGKMAHALRTEILQMQEPEEEILGECEITGDKNVKLKKVSVEGEEVLVGPRVLEAVNDGADWEDVLSGEHEFE